MRPDHWLKNVFILFGHGVAYGLLEPRVSPALCVSVVLSFVPACLVASANYILNEILDAPFDRAHPTKRFRPVAAGRLHGATLWWVMGALLVVAFALARAWFNLSYTLALALLFLSGLVYNVPPVRLKDRAFLDVIAESFNNPIRLWLGWYAVAPADSFPPLSILLAWWFFGALLMAGKRYAEYRFINDPARSALYRKSFAVYTEQKLVISMVTYANLFCFCLGVAFTFYRPNLLLVFPVIAGAIIVYFARAMTAEGARLEPEQLLRNPIIIASTALTLALAAFLAFYPGDLTASLGLLKLIRGGGSLLP